MPILKRYVDRAGYYLKSNIDGEFITLQLTAGAEKVLSELGYSPGSSVPLHLIDELSERGGIYTYANQKHIVSDSGGQLTDDERDAIQKYINNQSGRRLSTSVRDLIKQSVDKNRWDQTFRSISAKPFVKGILECLTEHPDPIHNIEVIGNSVEIVSQPNAEKGIKVKILDSRYEVDYPWDFIGSIEFEHDTSQNSLTAWIKDGYLVRWRTNDGDTDIGIKDPTARTLSSECEDAHKRIFSHAGSIGGMGFDPIEEPVIALQRFFLFLDHYGVRPDPRGGGHRKICTQTELDGQQIWVPVNRMVSSNKQSSIRIIDCELIDFTVDYEGSKDELFVKVPEGEQVEHKSSDFYRKQIN